MVLFLTQIKKVFNSKCCKGYFKDKRRKKTVGKKQQKLSNFEIYKLRNSNCN